jgi:hypothetical protein
VKLHSLGLRDLEPGTVARFDDLGMTGRRTAIGFAVLPGWVVADVPKSIKSYRFGAA